LNVVEFELGLHHTPNFDISRPKTR